MRLWFLRIFEDLLMEKFKSLNLLTNFENPFSSDLTLKMLTGKLFWKHTYTGEIDQ